MKKLTVIALSLVAAGAALADAASSPLSREAVFAAREAGQTATVTSASAVSRGAVLADLQRARASGELEAGLREVGPTAPKFQQGVGRSRAEVVAELEQARASGELNQLNSNQGGYAHLASLARPAAAQQLAGQPRAAQ